MAYITCNRLSINQSQKSGEEDEDDFVFLSADGPSIV